MKQINYLLLATILFFSNCSNDNGVDEMLSEEIVKITEADLVGDWLFYSLEFKDSIYYYDDCDKKLSLKYNLLNLSFLDVTLSEDSVATLTYYSDCGKTSENDEEKIMEFKIENKKIIFNNDNDYAYLILNYDEFDGETLRLELLKKSSILPTGGIYTLKKRL